MSIVSLCSTVGRNTGAIDCDPVRSNPQVIIVGSAVFPLSDTVDSDTFETAFIEKIKQSTGISDKLFPFPAIQGTTSKTVAAKYGTLGYGLQIKLLRSKQAYELQVLAGSSLEAALLAFDGKQMPIFIIDDNDNYNMWGVKDKAGNFSGAVYLFSVEPREFGDAQNAKTTTIMISIVNSRDFVENAALAPTSFGPNDLSGLLDVNLVEPTAHASNVHYIKTYVPTVQIGNGKDVTTQFGSLLAHTALWTAKTGATFSTSLAFTSIAYDATNDRMVFTFDTTAYGLLSTGAKIKLSAVDVPTLDAADVSGIEIFPIILTK
jgi:hypothetical protein